MEPRRMETLHRIQSPIEAWSWNSTDVHNHSHDSSWLSRGHVPLCLHQVAIKINQIVCLCLETMYSNNKTGRFEFAPGMHRAEPDVNCTYGPTLLITGPHCQYCAYIKLLHLQVIIRCTHLILSLLYSNYYGKCACCRVTLSLMCYLCRHRIL